MNTKIAIVCGGPSLERGISLNSARSVLDHLDGDGIEIIPYYLDYKKRPYKISKAQLYSNTPGDFDFKLETTAKPLNQKEFLKELKRSDLVFPVMHGPYGEDGAFQRLLEVSNIPFIGTGSESAKMSFDKFNANEYIKDQGFYILPSLLLKIYEKDHKQAIESFFKKHNIKRAVVKPASGGSSIGVFSVSTVKDALEKAEMLFSKRMDTRLVVEPFAQGKEFTVVILQNRFGLPVALIPTEIEADYRKHQIFDFRKKYLPTRAVTYFCPPRFNEDIIRQIQVQAEQLFQVFGYQDFARFDGWVLDDGNIWFSDFNPISGMEQNSFLFQQAARVGLTHTETLRHIVANAATRHGVTIPKIEKTDTQTKEKKPVSILFGGPTSERQVSLMSGTNVWLKLSRSQKYMPTPYLLDTKKNVWQVPYQLLLNHTVEEIEENCERYEKDSKRVEHFEKDVRLRLGYKEKNTNNGFGAPKKLSLETFIKQQKFIFIALHGGMGEDGELQKLLEKQNIPFNGSDEKTSKLCMDKWATSEKIESFEISGLLRIPSTTAKLPLENIETLWKETIKKLNTKTLVIKPRGDGCSTGVAHLYSERDLAAYWHYLKEGKNIIPESTLTNQATPIQLPQEKITDVLLEKYMDTDLVRVKSNTLKHTKINGLIEITVGVLEHKKNYHALSPSITVAEGEVLSLEEKFQGGTGINITPPPKKLVSEKNLSRAKKLIETLAHKLEIQGYARIDAFLNIHNGSLHIIEINTLPGLTPSTVLYQQGLAEKTPLYPRLLLETIIKNSNY